MHDNEFVAFQRIEQLGERDAPGEDCLREYARLSERVRLGLGTGVVSTHQALAQRMTGDAPQWFRATPNQATAYAYEPSRPPALALHTDHAALGETLGTLSLVQAWEMNFAHYRTEKPTIGVKLPARSLLLMNAEERYDWQHGITTMPRVEGKAEADRDGQRISITFRTVQAQWTR